MYKNSQKRIIEEGDIYFITCATKNRYPFFKERWLCEFWVQELEHCRELKKFELHAFCLLFDHFHLLIEPCGENNISEIMRSFKTNFSRDVNVLLGYTPKARSRDLAYNDLSRDRACGDWIKKWEKYGKGTPKFQWQKSFHDHVIRDDRDLENHFYYTELNFLKHGLPDDWRYSSYREKQG
jgi:putative transposase